MGRFASQVRVVGVSAVSHATRRRGLGVSPSPAHALHEPDDLGRPSHPVRFDELHDADAAHLQKFVTKDSMAVCFESTVMIRKEKAAIRLQVVLHSLIAQSNL